MKHSWRSTKPFSLCREIGLKQRRAVIHLTYCIPNDMIAWELMVTLKRRGSIMPAIFDFLYREYCRARLAEMRKQLLISNASQPVPEQNRDLDYPAGSAGRDSGFGDDGTAPQNEARHVH